MALDTSLNINSIHSLSLLDGGSGRHNTLLDVLLDEEYTNSHLFETSNVSLSIHSVRKRATLREGWQGSCRSFNGSDLDSSELTVSSNGFFQVKEKSGRHMPLRRTKILSLEENKELAIQPANNLLGILEGSGNDEFTPELISPKKLSKANSRCESRVRKVDRKSVISLIRLQDECRQQDLFNDKDVFEGGKIPSLQYESPSKQLKTFNNVIEEKLDSKRKERDLQKSTTLKQLLSDIHLQNKRDMFKESRTYTLFGNDDIQEESSFKNINATLRWHEKIVSQVNKKTSTTKESKNLSPSLDDFFASDHGKEKLGIKHYLLNTKDQSISESSVTSIDYDDIASKIYEMMPSSNSFTSPKIDTTRKKLSIYNRDINRSIFSSMFTSNSFSSGKTHRSDDSAPKQPQRHQSPLRVDK